MLSGFNTNVRHKGAMFHVQTEDSGRKKPHVITHLFHGGNILASEKQGYEHLLQEGELEPQVKRLMEEQHGAMLAKLKSGALDELIRARLGPEEEGARTKAPEPPARARARAADATVPPPPRTKPPAPAPAPPARQAAAAPAAERQRPLDEVVLDYLLESARQRKKR
jgi:hypothetical protein